ncbi:MAG: DUF4469 domain-containing protein [Treponema sp.]|nr:DUF4469 domain-containing protein [Treponema sp.]
MAAVLKKGILNALRQGESVNLFDIGLLYPTIRGTVHKDMSLTELAEHIHLSFTPSETAEKEVQSVIVKNVRFADAGRTIYTVINLYDEQAPDNTLTRGMTAQITGKAIKLGGDKNGLYFAPLDNKLVPVQDRSL